MSEGEVLGDKGFRNVSEEESFKDVGISVWQDKTKDKNKNENQAVIHH